MSKDLITFTKEEKHIIKNQFFPPTATDSEMIYCMNIAKIMGLNPITKEIFFVPRKAQVNGKYVDRIEPMLGRDSYIKVAHSTGLFAGIETTSEIKEIPKLVNGKWVCYSDLVATCKVWKKGIDKPFIVSVAYNEYVQTKKDGTITKFWKEKPDTMLKKVAESQALRKAFSINGAYSIEEVNDMYIDEPRENKKEIQEQEEPKIEQIPETEIEFSQI